MPSNFLDTCRIAIIWYACDCDYMRNSFSLRYAKMRFLRKILCLFGGCNIREIKTKPGINGLIQPTLPPGANFTEWHSHMYDGEMISDMSEHQNDIVPPQTIWNFSKKWWKNDENRRKSNSKFHKNTIMLLPDIGCIFPPKMK